MTLDPHYLPYGSLNIQREQWREFQKHDRLHELSEEVKKITDQGLVACVPKDLLDWIAFECTFNTDIITCLVPGYARHHWSGLALCVFTHSKMEYRETDTLVRFTKSPHDNEAYLEDNIERADSRKPYSINRLLSRLVEHEEPAVKIKEVPQLSLF